MWRETFGATTKAIAGSTGIGKTRGYSGASAATETESTTGCEETQTQTRTAWHVQTKAHSQMEGKQVEQAVLPI